MRLFKQKEHKDDFKELREQNERNARDIERIEDKDLKRVKERQAAISMRLQILQQEYDVQTAQRLTEK